MHVVSFENLIIYHSWLVNALPNISAEHWNRIYNEYLHETDIFLINSPKIVKYFPRPCYLSRNANVLFIIKWNFVLNAIISDVTSNVTTTMDDNARLIILNTEKTGRLVKIRIYCSFAKLARHILICLAKLYTFSPMANGEELA